MNHKKIKRLPGACFLVLVLASSLVECCRHGGACMSVGGDRMIVDKLDLAERYFGLHPGFQKAFEFLRLPSLPGLAPGRYDIDRDRVFCLISRGPGRRRTEVRLEAHRKYVDIQFVLEGTDEMGWKPASACEAVDQDYDPEKDVIFFKDKPRVWKKVQAGSFAVFFPADANAPMVSGGYVHKAVVKVAVE